MSISDPQALKCDTRLIWDMQINLRHDIELMLRTIKWHVPTARRVLEAIGCDYKKLLLTAPHKSGYVLNMIKLYPTN